MLTVGIRLSYAMLALAVLVGLWLALRGAESLEGIDRRSMRRASLIIALAVFAGGRLHFVVNQWHLFFADRPLAALKLWAGGFHAPGAIAALALAAPLVLRRTGISVGKFADGVAPAVGIGIAIARLGCFLQGCCFGTVCRWPWCLTFPRSAYVYEFHRLHGIVPAGALRSAPVHPLQLYFAAAGLLLTGVALWLHPRKRYDGQVGLVVLLVYAISALLLEFLRADYFPHDKWGPFSLLAWSSVVLGAVAALMLGVAGSLKSRGACAR